MDRPIYFGLSFFLLFFFTEYKYIILSSDIELGNLKNKNLLISECDNRYGQIIFYFDYIQIITGYYQYFYYYSHFRLDSMIY